MYNLVHIEMFLIKKTIFLIYFSIKIVSTFSVSFFKEITKTTIIEDTENCHRLTNQ